MNGYDALRLGAAWLDLSQRQKIIATGEDRARLLHAMTTNHVEQLKPGTGCYAFFLGAQGRILSDVNLICRPDDFLLDAEPEVREKLFKHLDGFIIADDVTLEDATSRLATIALEGPGAANILETLGAPVPQNPYDNILWNDQLVVRISYTAGPGFFIIGPLEGRDALTQALESAGAVAADLDAFRTVRIENGRPRYGEDISERFLAQETNQARAVHFQKGCYLGQEIVERVRSRGQIHRLLMPLHIDGVEPPEPGAKLHVGEAIAGEITSACFSPALGKVAALGYIRVDHAKPGDELSIGERRARVTRGV